MIEGKPDKQDVLMTYHDFIIHLLDLIDYKDDKEAFVTQFMGLTRLQTIGSLSDSLSRDRQLQLANSIDAAKGNPDAIAHVMEQYFSHDQIKEASNAVTLKELGGLIESIRGHLSAEQDQQLSKLLDSLNG